MNIIILHGPNLNLIGSTSSRIGQRITLDKINVGIRRHARKMDIELKIIQTHKEYHAINFIQRNRNWADILLFSPMAWARYEYAILDAIKVSDIKTVQILFPIGYSDIEETNSIFSSSCESTLVGPPDQIYLDAIDSIQTV